MTRWEPDALGRLEKAALDLFIEQGFEKTTVEDIATRAGVTKRTFFRYFTDKREVLFRGGDAFQRLFVDSLEAAPDSATPLEMVAASLDSVAADFRDRRDATSRRQLAITANVELRERELVKFASVSSAIAKVLRTRATPEPTASVLAELTIAVFRTAFEQWVATDEEADLVVLVHETLQALRAAAA